MAGLLDVPVLMQRQVLIQYIVTIVDVTSVTDMFLLGLLIHQLAYLTIPVQDRCAPSNVRNKA